MAGLRTRPGRTPSQPSRPVAQIVQPSKKNGHTAAGTVQDFLLISFPRHCTVCSGTFWRQSEVHLIPFSSQCRRCSKGSPLIRVNYDCKNNNKTPHSLHRSPIFFDPQRQKLPLPSVLSPAHANSFHFHSYRLHLPQSPSSNATNLRHQRFEQ